MTRTVNLWTPSLEREFHGAIQELYRETQIPSRPEGYAHTASSISPSGSHVLSLQDERTLADDLALLCHCRDGVQYVSAVTIQEHTAGLVIVVASNETPSDEVVDGLKKILGIAVEYGSTKRDRENFCSRMFDEVLRLNQARILGRIRPPRWKPPAHLARRAKPKLSLCSDVRRVLEMLRAIGSTLRGMEEVLTRVEELRDCLLHFNQTWRPDSPYDGIDSVVHACAALAILGSQRSLETHLESLGVAANTTESGIARQIDKLARYSLLCRALLRMARQDHYSDLFKSITVVSLPAFPAIFRRTTGQIANHECHVHAEVQQILHYEQNPHTPRPRVIGCSKSACYLCDMFIARHNEYTITHAHRRLYNKWTLPDARWMGRAQVQRYREVLRAMVRLLQAEIQKCSRPGQVSGRYPNESVAALRLFPSNSTLSRESSVGQESVARSSVEKARSSSSRSDSTLSTIVEVQELPLREELTFGQGPIEVEVGRSRFSFESLNTQSAVLSVACLAEPAGGLARSVDVDDIPTDDHMRIACSGGSSEVNFCVRVDEGLFVHVTVRWIELESSEE